MCYSPLKIFNPSKNPTYRDKMWLTVPCGKCADCKKRYRNDWFIRTYFEYLDCQSKHGTTIYVTLTYESGTLPLFGQTPVFSRDDIQKFLKRLRKSVKNYLGSDCVRYFITSEYGGQTHRSHYHGFIYFYYPNLTPYQISELKHIITTSWSYHGGFVSFGRPGNYRIRGVVENSQAFSYVAKYVGKDINFPYDEDIPKEYQPFHLQSNHLGEYMIEYFGLDKNTFYSFRMLVDGTFTLGNISSQFTYCIPQYITRKVLYDYEYKLNEELLAIGSKPYFIKSKSITSTFHLNKFGLAVKKERELHSLEYQLKELNTIFNNVRQLSNLSLSDDDIKYILGRSRYTLKYGTLDSLFDFLESSWFSWTDNEKLQMVCYTNLFKDRVVIPNALYSLSDECTCLNDAMLYLDDIYSLDVPSILNNDDISRAYEHSINNFKETVTRSLYSSNLRQDRYYIYEDLLSLFNAINFVFGCKKEQELLEQQQKYDNAKLSVAEVV